MKAEQHLHSMLLLSFAKGMCKWLSMFQTTSGACTSVWKNSRLTVRWNWGQD